MAEPSAAAWAHFGRLAADALTRLAEQEATALDQAA